MAAYALDTTHIVQLASRNHIKRTSKLMTSWLLETSTPVPAEMATPALSSHPSGMSSTLADIHFLHTPMSRESTFLIAR